MNNRFVYSVLLISLFFLASFSQSLAQSKEPYIYEIKIYQLKDSIQESRVDNFLKNAYIPALNRAGIDNVGVFKPVHEDTLVKNKMYVFIPFSSINEFLILPKVLEMDKKFKETGISYLKASYNNPPYQRMESILIQAFSGLARYQKSGLTNSSSQRVYELRSYESPTEALNLNKVKMFNTAEIDIFKRLDFNPIFYGDVLSGNHMPNLMYMTSFSDMESRDMHWKDFGEDSKWKELSGMEEFQNNVSHADIILLNAAPYSQL